MQQVSFKMRVLLFLYSTQNLVGSVLALCGLGLFFAGVIVDWWFPIVAALYGTAWLALPHDKALEFQILNESTQANLSEGMDDLIKQSKPKLPVEAFERLERIRVILNDLVPKIFGGGVAMNSVSLLTNAVTRDLPNTIKNYIALPPAFAAIHTVEQGKTCKQLLIEQLDLLEVQLTKIADNIYKDDADALIVNGKFLQEKFHEVSFQVS
jgi:hypothetical protein